MQISNITVIGGAGAIGSYFVKMLTLAGHNISILGRKNTSGYLEAIAQSGITLHTPEGTTYVPKEKIKHITDNIEEIGLTSQDYVIICTKAGDITPELADKARRLLLPNGKIVMAQNGLPCWAYAAIQSNKDAFLHSIDPDGNIIKTLGFENIIGCVLNIANLIEKPGVVKVIRRANSISIPIGNPDGKYSSAVEQLLAIFKESGINSFIPLDGIIKEALRKLQINIAINPISMITGFTVGEILQDPLYSSIALRLAEELSFISQSLSLGPLKNAAELYQRLAASRHHKSSMLIDREKKQPLEFNALIKAPIELDNEKVHHTSGLPALRTIEMIVAPIQKALCEKQEPNFVAARDQLKKLALFIQENTSNVDYQDEGPEVGTTPPSCNAIPIVNDDYASSSDEEDKSPTSKPRSFVSRLSAKSKAGCMIRAGISYNHDTINFWIKDGIIKNPEENLFQLNKLFNDLTADLGATLTIISPAELTSKEGEFKIINLKGERLSYPYSLNMKIGYLSFKCKDLKTNFFSSSITSNSTEVDPIIGWIRSHNIKLKEHSFSPSL